MGGSIRRMDAACLLCGLVGTGSAEAGGGRITFSGAVVVPTCNTSIEVIAPSAILVHPRPNLQRSCAESGPAESSVSIYTVMARQLTHGEPDHVLNYFEGYIRARQADATPVLVTRIYE